MKRLVLTVFVSLLAGGLALAQAPAAPAASTAKPATPPVPGNRIAVIDFRSALMDSDAGKIAQQQYEKEITPEKTKVEKLQREFDELQTKLQNAKTDDEKRTITRDINNKTTEAQRAQDDAQRISQELQDKLLPPVATMVNKAVEEYSKENNLAVVFDPRTDPSNIIYTGPALDITAEVMRRMNAELAKNPKAATPSAVPAPPK